MKIGISCYPSQGGSGVVATELGQGLAQRGHEVHFITSSLPVRLRHFEHNIYFHEVRPENYPVFLYPPYSLSLAAKMADVTETYGLDILHAHYAMPHAAGAYLARQMMRGQRPVKIVTTLHGTDITLVGQAPGFHRVTKFSIEESDCVTSVSDWLRRETVRLFDITKPISVIPNFVDNARFRPQGDASRRKEFATPEEKLLLHISNFRPVKNVEIVVEVFDRVSRSVPSRLLLVGDGPEWSTVSRRVHERGLQERVHFLGNQDHIEELMPLADAFLLPSHHESFGLVALESLACGVPVVATRVGGTGEVVEDGVTGYLRDPGDVEALTQAVMRLFSNPEKARAMGRRGVQVAADRFPRDRIVPLYEQLYASCHPYPVDKEA